MKTIIMASPVNFSVQYSINPWMNGNIGSTDKNESYKQWSNLRNELANLGADVIVLPHSPEYCPDTVFTANAGLIYKNRFLLSNFRHEERAAEEPFFEEWFKYREFSVSRIKNSSRETFSFEGAGDALFSSDRSILWMGFGFRTNLNSKVDLDAFFDDCQVVVRPLELVDERFYHLDTCFCPLDTGEVLWFPEAFSDYSRYTVETWYKGKLIEVNETDALKFSCNSVSIGTNIITPKITPYLEFKLKERGYTVIQVEMSEFLKSGGACKCCTLECVE